MELNLLLLQPKNMIQIPHQQILDRYDTLPESLKDAGFSPYNTSLIQKIGEQNHLSEEKISTISLLVGYILFGFVHPEDLAKEIKIELNIAPEIANSIADEIDRKIFMPIRSDLEKVYQPAVAAESVVDLRTIKPPEAPSITTAVPEQPKTEPSIKGLTEAPVVIKPETKSEAPQIIPETKPEVAPMVPTQEAISSEGEAEPTSGELAEPFILHKETEVKPISGMKKPLGGFFGFLKKKEGEMEEKPEPVKAEVEISGKTFESQAPKIAKTEVPKIRVVHYSEFKTPVSPFGGETISQPKIEKKLEEPPYKIEKPVIEKPVLETEKPLAEEKIAMKPIGIKPPLNLPVETKPMAEIKPPVPPMAKPEIKKEEFLSKPITEKTMPKIEEIKLETKEPVKPLVVPPIKAPTAPIEPTLDLRPKPTAVPTPPPRPAVQPMPPKETKPELLPKKAPTLAEGEVGVPTPKGVGEEEEMIDLSKF